MAIRFKSKYTAEEIEQLLDFIKNSLNGNSEAIIAVEALPDVTSANSSVFYKWNNRIYFVNDNEWVEISAPINSTTISGDITIEGEEESIRSVIDFSDFVSYEDDLHLTLISGSKTDIYISALRQLMREQQKTYYTLTDIEVFGFIEGFEGNNILSAVAADNNGHFFIKIDLINGHEVNVTLEQVLEDGTELYLIEYAGYVL